MGENDRFRDQETALYGFQAERQRQCGDTLRLLQWLGLPLARAAGDDVANVKRKNSDVLGWTLLILPSAVMLLAYYVCEIVAGQFSWMDGIELLLLVSTAVYSWVRFYKWIGR